MKTDWATICHFGYFRRLFVQPIFAQLNNFNKWFDVGILNFQKQFDLDVSGLKIKHLLFSHFGYFFKKIGQNIIQIFGHTDDAPPSPGLGPML
jgi:hypothetical protein